MNAIRICTENLAAIEAALKAINGRAYDHSYTTYAEIKAIATAAESRVIALVGSQARAVGATWIETSGGTVNNTYARKAFSRAATTVSLTRRATGWFLTAIVKTNISQHGGGQGRLTLTQAQADYAVAQFKATFAVAPAAVLAAAA